MDATADAAAGHLLLIDLTPPDAPHHQQVTITVSPERVQYNEIRMRYERRAEQAEAAFSQAYAERIGDLDQLIAQVNELAAAILVPELFQTVSDLVALGAYSLSEAMLLWRYGEEGMGWGQGYLWVADQYAEIIMDAQQLDAYRDSRRKGRGRVMAMGDFGGGLARSYIMTAGVGVAVGALRHALSGLGNSPCAIGDPMKKARVFNNPETKASFCADIYRAVFMLHFAFIDAANDVLGANITGMDEDDEVQDGLGLLGNILKGRLPADRVPEMLGRCLTLAPYNKEIYDFILRRYGDPTGSLARAAAYFGIDMGVTEVGQIERQG